MGGIRRKGRQSKGWRDKDEEDLNMLEIKTRETMARDRQVCKKTILEYKA